MRSLIFAAMDRSRTTLLTLLFLIAGGIAAFQTIPKEANPDITIPIIYVSMTLDGISPEDAERLLVRPMEQELRSLEGIKEMRGRASEGFASVMLEFDAGFDSDKALQDVRERVDTARSKLPDEADEPQVNEINVSLFPVLSVGLSGPLSERELITVARALQDAIEAIPEVLEVEIGGDREDLLEVVVDPQVLESYGIDFDQLAALVTRNNQLVAAGSLDTGKGRMALKVPGVIESVEDVMSMPVKVDGDTVVTFGDVAMLQRTFKDPTGFARINGEPALVLEVTKRTGANIINTVEKVRELIRQARPQLPDSLEVRYIMDQSGEVRDILSDLLNNVLTAIVLVIIVVIAAMGPRSALLVGLTIPGAFLTGILVIYGMGLTLNIVVLFSLILVAGMLVDGAIVVSELADRNLSEGRAVTSAWAEAASRMAWPIIASTATTLAVFVPLLFWPGVVGEFMKFLPLTVIICLTASLAMALVFLPVLGGVSGGRRHPQPLGGGRLMQTYRRVLANLLKRPGTTLLGVLAVIGLIYAAYGKFNHGVEFFPSVEPDSAQVQIRARGDLSIQERDAIVRQVEQRLTAMPEVEALYARSMITAGNRAAPDVIGVLQFQFTDWHTRRPASAILKEFRARTDDLPGIRLEFREQEGGPAEGKPIELQVSSRDSTQLNAYVDQIQAAMAAMGGFVDVEDDRSLPGIEWRLNVDREAAARFSTDVLSVGSAVRLVTNGLVLATYRPEDVRDEVDIAVRVPNNWRELDQLQRQTINTARGQVPLSQFVDLEPGAKTNSIVRVDGQRTVTIKSELAAGRRVDEALNRLQEQMPEPPEGVSVRFAGENEDQQQASRFLTTAFLVAVAMMLLILVTQFNSLYQTLLILSAILLSTAGVLLGLLLNGQAFGIVMVGMGIIALGGIVVNNNIILIDTYNQMRRDGLAAYEAALETGCLRLRPVVLTAITTILGLMPMVLGVNVDLLTPALGLGAPSTQWWTQLSSAIAGGLAFATVLTLLLTPALLVLGERTGQRLRRLTGRDPAA
ncbi:efflux RND transporter permease subunit [Marinobacter qingdaonensis]|uniref:Efflux RND transporter permease subunit n=1 Tax=Marinobacter qingdaonensis TaxID=3108486 RepID=A0ABU5NTW8_9GAMM|nr:efflux RND transporter permease subunit [Marinobacter sp. ASW11-75]MEA1079254.1 efflux RND transporter permease subunit [Marinobacter sp. ASW11-75]